MEWFTAANIALLISLVTGVVLPGLRYWKEQRDADDSGKIAGRKQTVDENISFAKEWREYAEKQEARVISLEAKLDKYEKVEVQNKLLDARVQELEGDMSHLRDAFEYVLERVVDKEVVANARRIAAGKMSRPSALAD